MTTADTERRDQVKEESGVVPVWLEIFVPGAILVCIAVYMWDLSDIPRPEKNLLMLRPVLLVLLSLLALIGWKFVLPASKSWWGAPGVGPQHAAGGWGESVGSTLRRRSTLLMLLLIGYAVAVFTTNYVASTVVFVAATSWLMGWRSKILVPLLAVATALVLFLTATQILHIRM